MPSNLLRKKLPGLDSPATRHGPKPGDFALGSAESRAAARAIVLRLAEKEGPQPGDIFIDLGFLGPERAVEIYHAIRSTPQPVETPDPILGGRKMWLKFPDGFNPDSLPDSTPPLTLENAPDDLLDDVIRCYNEAFRKAKQSGIPLPPEIDPDLVWNGMAYVPKQPSR